MIIPQCIIDVVAKSTPSVSSSMVCDDIHHCRTVPGIIFNCASTMFLCTWVAFHPDVPGNPEEKWWKKLVRRIKFMVVALLAPEYVFWNAFWEWVNSGDDVVKVAGHRPNCRLTETHYMFGRMGGFQLVNEGKKVQLREHEFYSALIHGRIQIPTIKEGEIQDRSKTDHVAKAITFIQTLWFGIQAAHRISQGLPVTEFELTTLGHVVLNIFICWCWWKKPLNVNYPVDVFPMSKADVAAEKRKPAIEDGAGKDVESQQKPAPFPFRARMGAYVHGTVQGGSFTLQILFIFGFLIVGGAFGAVHCLAWNSTFPTRIEHILWRVAALLVTAIPGIVFSLFMVYGGNIDKLGETLKSPWVTPLMVIYCLARMCLLVLALVVLRTLPYKAYISPSWTRYIPHIG